MESETVLSIIVTKSEDRPGGLHTNVFLNGSGVEVLQAMGWAVADFLASFRVGSAHNLTPEALCVLREFITSDYLDRIADGEVKPGDVEYKDGAPAPMYLRVPAQR